MKKFEAGEKYAIKTVPGFNYGEVGTIEIVKRTAKFITYNDTFFGRTNEKKKIELDKYGNERISAFYCGVSAIDRKAI